MSATAPRRNEVKQDGPPRVRTGDRDGFRQTVAPHEPMIYRAAWSLTEDQESAIELSQEAVLLAWTDMKQWSANDSIRQRLAKNVIAAARATRRASEIEARPDYSPRYFEPWETLSQGLAGTAQFRTELHIALRALPYEWREAFVLRDMLGFPTSECSEILQLSLERTRQYISNARLQVRDELVNATRQQSAGGGQ